MHDALAEARRQLGENATVLHTKQYETAAWLGLGRRQEVEILAAAERPASAIAGGAPVHALTQAAGLGALLARVEPKAGGIAQEERSPAVERLVRNGVQEALAETMLQELADDQDSAAIIDIIERRIKCLNGNGTQKRQSRVVLVGPTGVGKTTTAAKLAARHSLVEGKKVALVTLDTYRVGAVEQLATYARILNVPIEVALCPEDVDALVARHRDKDVIIIDTVGRSQRSRTHLTELAQFVRAASPTEVHLVVSASSSSAVQKEAVSSFSALSADRLIMTKLDECPQPGCILDLAVSSLLPYSYITFGQEVPDDIAVAEKDRLARLVWEGVP
jgi:flagellar biosynthesis protein FlhF